MRLSYKGEKKYNKFITINQRSINKLFTQSSKRENILLHLEFWYTLLEDIEIAYVFTKNIYRYKKTILSEYTKKDRIIPILFEMYENKYDCIRECKGYSETNMSKDFWTFRGWSEKDSIKNVKQYQSNNSLKRIEKYSINEMRQQSCRCVEHWMNKGYTRDESKEIISSRQSKISRIYYENRSQDDIDSVTKKRNITRTKNGFRVADDKLDDFNLYRRKVSNYTNRHSKHLKTNGFEIDHIISKYFGFKNGILPSEIGNINNLQLLTRFENASKGPNSYSVIDRCKHIKDEYYEQNKS